MTPRPSGAPVLITAVLALSACMTARAAVPDGPITSEALEGAAIEGSPLDHGPLESVADYLSAFAHAYAVGPYDAALLRDAEAAARHAGYALAPDVTFEQTLSWTAYASLDLGLDAELRLPLYDSRAGPSIALSGADLEAARVAVAAGRADAELSFFVDLATFATLAEASTSLSRVLERLATAPWLTDPAFEPVNLAPADRGLFEGHLRLIDMSEFLADQHAELARRIARLLRTEAGSLVAPSSAAVRAALPAQPDPDTCLLTAPAASAARLRHRQTVLAEALDAAPAVTVALTSDVAVTLVGPGPTGGGVFQWTPSATFALEARVALPPGRAAWQDVDGTLAATASPTGASQSFRISWPRPPRSVALDTDQDGELDSALRAIASNLGALRRVVTQAASERARLQRAVDWLLVDTLGTTVRPLDEDIPPVLAAQVADLNAQLAFAALDEVVASVQLAAACGAWP